MFPTATVIGHGENLSVQHGNDKGLFVRFYWNKVAEKHYVKINVPGDQRTEWDRPVQERDKQRFREQWEAYQANQNQFGKQTMLKDWGLLQEERVTHYNARNVHTVEHLAALTDTMIQACGMGTREDQRKAQGWMQEQVALRQNEVMHTELAKRDAQIAMLTEKLDALAAKPSAPVEPPIKNTLGLPRKEARA